MTNSHLDASEAHRAHSERHTETLRPAGSEVPKSEVAGCTRPIRPRDDVAIGTQRPPTEPRSAPVSPLSIDVTDAQREALKNRAAREGKTLREWVLDRLFAEELLQ